MLSIDLLFICFSSEFPFFSQVAGYMGNQMDVKVQDADPPFGCLKNSYIRVPLWLDAIAATLFPECWQHKMELHYNKKLHKSFSNKGVHIGMHQFGSTNGVDYISPFPQQNRISEYYAKLIRSLELKAGYKRNKDIFGAQYDWRKSAHEQPEFFEKLRQLVERAYFVNNHTPVILLGHSMGGNFVYIFLRMMRPEWKKKFVRTAFFMAVPWGGNVKYLYSYLYNDDFAGNILPMFREIERDYSSLAFLLPNRRIFGDDVLLQTPTSKYTTYNLDKLMIRLGRPNVIPMWLDTRNIMDPFLSPGTDIICVGGIGFNTMRKIILTQDALIDGKYRRRLRRSADDFVGELQNQTINELYRTYLNRTANLYNLSVADSSSRRAQFGGDTDTLSGLEGKPTNRRTTQRIIEQTRGLFNTMFGSGIRALFSFGNRLSQSLPFSLGRIRDNFLNSRRFEYYWHIIQNVINPALPKNAYDVKQGRYVFFSEGDSFVNIESLMGCLKWYDTNSKNEFYFDLINDSHLGMLRNKASISYFTKLIMAIR